MALNYQDRLTLLPQLRPRVEHAIAKYALYLLGGTPTAGQEAWARGALADLAGTASRTLPYLLSEPQFEGTDANAPGVIGTAISDAAIQSRVEAVANDHLIVEA